MLKQFSLEKSFGDIIEGAWSSLWRSQHSITKGGGRTPEDGGLEIEEAVCRGVQGVDLGVRNEEGGPSTSRFFPTAAHMSSNRDFTIHGPGHLKNSLNLSWFTVENICNKFTILSYFLAFSCIALCMLTGLANTNSLHLPNLCMS